MNREDFEILNQNIIYLDNSATTLKPSILPQKTSEYYNNYSANAHRGDYDISQKVDTMYENTRTKIKKYINAKSNKEIIFTNGSTDSLNKIIFGYFKKNLKENDEVLITKSEHASNILPWFELKDQIGIKIKYIKLTKDHKVTLENIKKQINKNTKVISVAHITNVIGDIRPIKEIIKLSKEKNIEVLIDAAQSIGHTKIDVTDLDVDFLIFSAHKMLGPTGLGIIYGKEKLLNNINPVIFGGGMNLSFESNGSRIYKDLPYLLEAGTPNIAAVIGFGSIIDYINNIGLNNIKNYEEKLTYYTKNKLKEIENIIIYNELSESSIIIFNYKNISAKDLANYLNKYNICVRAGNHCAKLLKDEIKVKNTCRISLYFYNTKEEIDILINALKNITLNKI